METKTKETPVETLLRLAKKYALLFNETRSFYEELNSRGVNNHGHGFDHDLMVAQYSVMITEDERVGELAWVAALLHSIDRHFPSEGERVAENRLNLVSDELLSINERLEILEAVSIHSKKNSDEDGPVAVVLKDADRLANIGALNITRGGQHRPNIPAATIETLGGLHPESTFRNPKSCYDATIFNNEWEAMLRLPKAKELGHQEFEYTAEWRRRVEQKFADVGLYPYPFK